MILTMAMTLLQAFCFRRGAAAASVALIHGFYYEANLNGSLLERESGSHNSRNALVVVERKKTTTDTGSSEIRLMKSSVYFGDTPPA